MGEKTGKEGGRRGWEGETDVPAERYMEEGHV